MLRSELVEQVRVNLLRYLEQNRGVTVAATARAAGYAPNSLRKFIARKDRSLPMAVALVRAIPEIGAGLACPHCGAVRCDDLITDAIG